MTYKAGSAHYFVSDAWREEILDLGDKARDWYEAGYHPFDDEGFYRGYKQALKDMMEFANMPLSGGPD